MSTELKPVDEKAVMEYDRETNGAQDLPVLKVEAAGFLASLLFSLVSIFFPGFLPFWLEAFSSLFFAVMFFHFAFFRFKRFRRISALFAAAREIPLVRAGIALFVAKRRIQKAEELEEKLQKLEKSD